MNIQELIQQERDKMEALIIVVNNEGRYLDEIFYKGMLQAYNNTLKWLEEPTP